MTWGDAGTPITAMGMAVGATLAFRVGGELRVAVVVKATFVLAPDGAMVLVDADPIVRADQPRDSSPTSSLVAAGDLVPYRPRADVLLQGHARAPRAQPTPAMAVRLMVARGAEVVLDKRLAVRGTPDPTGKTREPAPFAAMLLAWELSALTPDNPVGIRETHQAWPHILDPRHRERPAGFGPLSPRWPSRRRLLNVPESAFAGPVPAVPRDLAWAYFNAAPEDQQVDFFRGDEWIGFEGMNSQLPRVQSYLPGVVGRARVYGPTDALRSGQALSLVADTVTVDTDRLRCSVVWRGSFPVADEKQLAALQVFAGVETVEHQLSFPAAYAGPVGGASSGPPSGVPRITTAASSKANDESRTMEMAVSRAAPATPFGPTSTPPPSVPSRRLPAATPFEGAHLAPAPAPADAAGTIDISGFAAWRAANAAPAPPSPPEETVDDGELLPELAGTLPIGPHAPHGLASVLPFGRASSPAPTDAGAWRPEHSAAPALDAGSTVDFTALLAGKVLPFTAGGAPPSAAPTMPTRAALPSPTAGPRPRVPNAGATVAIDLLLLGNALPFGDAAPAAPVGEAQPVLAAPAVAAPAFAPAYAPVASAPTTFAPVPATVAPVTRPALLQAIEPVPDVPEGDAPKTLGAFFLAAMARAGRSGGSPGIESVS